MFLKLSLHLSKLDHNLKKNQQIRFKTITVEKKVEIKSKNTRLKNYFFTRKFQKLYGIGINLLLSFYRRFGLNIRLKNNQFNSKININISKLVDKFTYKNNLKSLLLNNRRFILEKLKNYKSIRHSLRYPVRGQRTHTNAKTRKKLKYEGVCSLT